MMSCHCSLKTCRDWTRSNEVVAPPMCLRWKTARGARVVENFYEVRAPDSAEGVQFETPAEWAERYPTEQAWRLRKVGV